MQAIDRKKSTSVRETGEKKKKSRSCYSFYLAQVEKELGDEQPGRTGLDWGLPHPLVAIPVLKRKG